MNLFSSFQNNLHHLFQGPQQQISQNLVQNQCRPQPNRLVLVHARTSSRRLEILKTNTVTLSVNPVSDSGHRNTNLPISCSSHNQSVLIGVKYCNCLQTLDVYLLFAVWVGQIKSKLIYIFVTYGLASGQFVQFLINFPQQNSKK